jgi:hypothetical protein
VIFLARSLSPARIIGLTAFLFALVSCVIAWVRGRGNAPHPRRLAAVLTLLQAALLLDVAFNGRWLLHDMLANVAKASSLYGDRSGPQHVALALLSGAVVTGFGLALWTFRGRPGAALAACGGILSLCCWCVEVISLHAVDGFLYRRVDGVMLVRLAWAACSLMTGAGILWDTFAMRPQARPNSAVPN